MEAARNLLRRRSHQPGSPRGTHNPHGFSHVQGAQGAQPPIGRALPSTAGRSQGPAFPMPSGYAQSGNPPRGGPNDGAFAGGFGRHNITPPSYDNGPIAQTNSFSYAQQPSPSNLSQNELYNWFVAIDQDGNGSLSFEELRHALLTNGNLQFSINTVKYLVSIFDKNGDGVIGFEEFEPLWKYLNSWRQLFDSFDINDDGRIDTAELGRALGHYNIHVSPQILDMAVRKYETPSAARSRQQGYAPQMDLDHFVCVCVVVRQMCTLFERCTAGGGSQISRDDYLKAILSLP